MEIKSVEKAKLKMAGMLFVVSCMTIVISSYDVVTNWWQQTHNPSTVC